MHVVPVPSTPCGTRMDTWLPTLCLPNERKTAIYLFSSTLSVPEESSLIRTLPACKGLELVTHSSCHLAQPGIAQAHCDLGAFSWFLLQCSMTTKPRSISVARRPTQARTTSIEYQAESFWQRTVNSTLLVFIFTWKASSSIVCSFENSIIRSFQMRSGTSRFRQQAWPMGEISPVGPRKDAQSLSRYCVRGEGIGQIRGCCASTTPTWKNTKDAFISLIRPWSDG